MIDIKAIRAAAEAATQGGWMASDNGHIYSAGLQLLVVAQHCRDKEANAKHIATANPSTVLAMCDEIERLRKDAARYQWLRSEHERFDPVCHLAWKQHNNRAGRTWVNTTNIDAAIDAAMEAK